MDESTTTGVSDEEPGRRQRPQVVGIGASAGGLVRQARTPQRQRAVQERTQQQRQGEERQVHNHQQRVDEHRAVQCEALAHGLLTIGLLLLFLFVLLLVSSLHVHVHITAETSTRSLLPRAVDARDAVQRA